GDPVTRRALFESEIRLQRFMLEHGFALLPWDLPALLDEDDQALNERIEDLEFEGKPWHLDHVKRLRLLKNARSESIAALVSLGSDTNMRELARELRSTLGPDAAARHLEQCAALRELKREIRSLLRPPRRISAREWNRFDASSRAAFEEYETR